MTDEHRGEERLSLRVTEIGEYIRHHSCARRFKLEIHNRALARRLPFSQRLFNTLDPVLREQGRLREVEWEAYLREEGLRDLTHWPGRPEADDDPPTWEEFAEAALDLEVGEAGYGREVVVSGEIGAARLRGRIDFLVVSWNGSEPRLRIVETKASRRDRTYHRIQVALYKLIVVEELEHSPLIIAGARIGESQIDCVVGRIDESTSESQRFLEIEPFDLAIEEADVRRLIDSNGRLVEISDSELDDLPYELSPKCDGCVFNVDCFPESAIHRRHELLGVTAPTAGALRARGFNTLDDLAQADPASPAVSALRTDPGVADNVDWLITRANTRRATLPTGTADPDNYEVRPLPFGPTSQLPEHFQGGQPMVRVYMSVDYDYTENRIGALAAHVTKSDWRVHTGFVEAEGRWRPDPSIVERQGPTDEDRTFEERPISGRNVVVFQQSEWSGHYEVDTGSERALLQQFVGELIDAIADVAETAETPIHLYVWSRSEMAHLVEACSRAHTRLLGALTQLLGCRRSLEQLIYSCLSEEVDGRYALGWTGRGLVVATSLRWFGTSYHWHRHVAGRDVDLDRVLEQDIFDFKTTLGLTQSGEWAADPETAHESHRFEIRSRFFDSLTAPYWRAVWGTLPNPESAELKADEANAIRRYNRASEPGMLRAYLIARTHALRWIEERVRFKNDEITKPSLAVNELRGFDLGVNDVAQAGIDFLRLDHFVGFTDWIHKNFAPVATRVPSGRTLPLANVTVSGPNLLTARINVDDYGIDLHTLRSRCPYVAGSMVRLAPHSGEPLSGQTLRQLTAGGVTGRITRLDWETGEVELSRIFGSANAYVAQSNYPFPADGDELFPYATIHESVSDFVAGRVENRLQSGVGNHAFEWFDPSAPILPPAPSLSERDRDSFEHFVEGTVFSSGHSLAEDQRRSVLDGLEATVQLLQGPPGTGKTQTATASVVARIVQRAHPGDVVLIAANTHTAVDNLLIRLETERPSLIECASSSSLNPPLVHVAKVHSSNVEDPVQDIENFLAKPSARVVNRLRDGAVLVIGGTTNALLKLAEELSQRLPWRDRSEGFTVQTLIVDEASMMVFPHFLALASLVQPDGRIMLAGDHRQLAPILAHDWEGEDRPPMVHYQPYASAYEAIRRLESHNTISDRQIKRSSLELTFRLPRVIVDLIGRLYSLDDIELQGIAEEASRAPRDAEPEISEGFDPVWDGRTGLYLVLHTESQSQQSNPVEAEILRRIIAAGHPPNSSVAVITPHRAQRSLLSLTLEDHQNVVDVIDTVERLQGGEKPIVIVSGTASDPAAIARSAEFLLDLNRSNVAFSRSRERLIVVCSRNLLDHIPPELEDYQSSMLWKSLRALCSLRLASTEVEGHSVDIYTVPVG